jgi:hypothetical protein
MWLHTFVFQFVLFVPFCSCGNTPLICVSKHRPTQQAQGEVAGPVSLWFCQTFPSTCCRDDNPANAWNAMIAIMAATPRLHGTIILEFLECHL